ncbi:MAG: Na+/H+ antiporter [Chloroflexia bacterium]
MNEIELILLLLVVLAALTPIARMLRVPYPILLVVGGLVLALLPIVPDLELSPEFVFLLFLPPLVYRAAFATSIRDFRSLLKPILSLSIGLVLATMSVVAVALHTLVPEIGWPLAFAFGAIVSPPDAVAAAAVFRGLGVPRHIATLLEGESLVNDATALVALGAALGATTIAFSMGELSIRFAYVGLGGIIVGLAVAVIVGWVQQRIEDPPVEITLSLLTPFAAYLPAESLGTSGVLAAVAAGLYFGWRSPYIFHSEARLRGRAVWDMVEFLLNGLVFILIGLQLSNILPNLAGRSMFDLISWGLILSLAVIMVRLVWVYLDTYLRHWFLLLWPSLRARHHTSVGLDEPNPRELFVTGWAGMRGVVSLAAALALPVATPERDLLIFLTFFVILATLVGQGLSLPLVIRALNVGSDASAIAQQEIHARRTATEAATLRIEQLSEEWPDHMPLIETLRSQYDHRASHLTEDEENPEHLDQELVEHHLIRRAVIEAERTAVLELRARGEIDDEVWRHIERDFDLEDLRIDA